MRVLLRKLGYTDKFVVSHRMTTAVHVPDRMKSTRVAARAIMET